MRMQIVKESYVFRELDVLLLPEDSAEHSIASGIGIYHFLGNEELDLHPNMVESLVVYKDALALYKVSCVRFVDLQPASCDAC